MKCVQRQSWFYATLGESLQGDFTIVLDYLDGFLFGIVKVSFGLETKSSDAFFVIDSCCYLFTWVSAIVFFDVI